MIRDLSIILDTWRSSADRKPLLIRGARQVGKTWLVDELGKTFESYLKIDFEQNPVIGPFFEGNLDPEQLTTNLSNYLGIKILPGKTLLFFDEVQACPRAITSLRYFYEKMPELHVIAAGSLIEFELRKLSVPVGRVEFLYAYPMTFAEFICALGKEELREFLLKRDQEEIPVPIHDQLLQLVRDYILIGGMPHVVSLFASRRDIHACRQAQMSLLETYRVDFVKYAKKTQVQHIRSVFDSAPLQLGRKFKYSHVSRDVKSNIMAESVDLLEMAGVLYRVYHTNANGLPLGAEVNLKKFKVLFFDTGLAQALLGLDIKPLLLDPDITQINNGALAELFVGLELIGHSNPLQRANIFYWHREAKSSNAEVDYLISSNEKLVPVEVKSGSEGRLYSLKRFLDEKPAKTGYRISKFKHSSHDNILTLPFYGIEAFLKNRQP